MEIGAAYATPVGTAGSGTAGAAAARSAPPEREPAPARASELAEAATPAPDAAETRAVGVAERNVAAVVSFAALRDDTSLAGRYAELARGGTRPPLSAAFDRTAAPRFDARA